MLEELTIVVTGTRFENDSMVRIDFRGYNDNRSININGYIPDVPMMEYFSNATSLEAIGEFVRAKLIEVLSTPTGE